MIIISSSRSAGKTKVMVSFSCEFKSSGSNSQTKFYNASTSVLVVPDLPLALGVPITWVLPPHYTMRSVLPSSSESHSQWDSQSRKGTIVYSLLRNFYEKSEVVQKDTISIDGDRVRTTESNNIACIQAKDRTTGRTDVAACIKVVEVWIFCLMARPIRCIQILRLLLAYLSYKTLDYTQIFTYYLLMVYLLTFYPSEYKFFFECQDEYSN